MADVKKILSQMTLDEKIGQLMQFNGNTFIDSKAEITGPMKEFGISEESLCQVGHVLNFTNAKELYEIQKDHLEKDRNRIPLTFMMDVIHGYRTLYPIPLAMGSSFDPDLMFECTSLAREEASKAGVQVTFAPMVDYVRDARWGRVMETCGEDVLLNSKMGAAQVKAFQGDDLAKPDALATCVKHFAAYGGAEGGRDYNTVELSEHTLREYYFPAYKACLDAGAAMVMPSFNVVNGQPALANTWLMRDILRKEWGFNGVTISDYAAIEELKYHGVAETLRDRALVAFKNGCDIEMATNAYLSSLKGLIEDGTFSEDELDEAVLRVLELKNKLGLFENPYKNADVKNEYDHSPNERKRAIVRRAASECAVLLKNDGILPISQDVKKIALIGPFAKTQELLSNWCCRGRTNEVVTVLDGVKSAFPNAEITVCEGCSYKLDDTSTEQFGEAVAAVKNADLVILCIGESYRYCGEAHSRSEVNIPKIQLDLLNEIRNYNQNIVALTFSGRPLVFTPIKDSVRAILHMWLPGTEGGNAAADLLSGKANPCGKVSMSFPKSSGQCPIYYNALPTGRPKPIEKDDEFCGYATGYVDVGNLALYPFGFGLSYSNFVYEDLKLSKTEMTKDDEIEVTVTVYNDSDVEGKETVMIYYRDVFASMSRPVQQLLDFKKVFFKAHERKEITFKVREENFRFWNVKNEYISEKGEFLISTGYADNLIHTKSLYLK